MMRQLKVGLTICMALASLSASAFETKQDAGGFAGAIIGGVVGNQIGGGSGRIIATGLGAIIGAAVGSSIGASLDKMDQMALKDAQVDALEAPVGTPTYWNGADYGSNTGAHGRFVTTREGYHRQYTNETCRSYQSTIQTPSKTETRSGTTCQRTDGSWYEVNSREVTFY